MISTFDYIQKHPLRAKRLLGISYEQFTNLVDAAKKAHEDEQKKLEQSKIRIHRLVDAKKYCRYQNKYVCGFSI
jgi:hypothetical protein